MRAAIYARYSSDNQRDASIADQLRICREFAARQDWAVVQEFTDHAISGATLLRSGFQALMWKQDGDMALTGVESHAIEAALTAGAGRVETLELGHRYGHLSPLVNVA
jgi:hypothetical protein